MKWTIQQIKKYKQENKNLNKVARVYRTVFEDPENIIEFAWTVFPHHLTSVSPDFHYELIELVNQETNVGVAAPRGHAKSTIINLIYVAWCIVNKRYHYIISISDTYSQSVGFVNTLKYELENNLVIQWLYGPLRGELWQDGRFETLTNVMVQARAYGMKIRGLKYKQYRPQLLLFDDLENDESVQNIDQREKLKNWVTRAALPALAKGGRAIMIGTILHGDSLLMNVINRKGEFAGWLTKLYKALNVTEDGEEYSLWPEMYSVQELKAMRDDPNDANYKGSLVFAQEYQNEPIDEMDAIVRRQWIDVIPEVPKLRVLSAFTCDPAIAKTDEADFFAKARGYLYYEVQEFTNIKEPHIMITQLGNDKLSFKEGVEDIARWYEDERVDKIGIEEVAFQEAYRASLPMSPVLPITALKPDKDKRRRMIAASRFFEAKRIHFKFGIKNLQTAIDQLTHFPSVKHDDLCDAICYLIDLLIFSTYSIPPAEDEDDPNSRALTAGLRSKVF